MSRQSLIDNYFKLRASPSIITTQKSDVKPTMNKVVKKRNLSLIKRTTPSKSPKISDENKHVVDVINLCSDDEDIWDNSPKKRSPCEDLTQRSNDSEDSVTDCSMSTVIYSPGKKSQSPTTPRKNKNPTPIKKHIPRNLKDEQDNNNLSIISTPIKTEPCEKTPLSPQKLIDGQENNNNPTQITQQIHETPQKRAQGFQTPRKSPQSGSSVQSSQVSSHKSPQSREKFFSPVRKRSVVKRPANGPKRSLEMSRSTASRILFEDELFANACEGMDDKTIFLLQIINKYLNTPSLKCLLESKSQTLLSNCLQVVKPGMRLICRLYWRKEGWYKKDLVAQICSEDPETIDENSFQTMISSLVENGLLVQSNTQNITFDHFISMLKKDDLVDICKELKMNINSKQNAVEALRGFSKRTSNISNFLTGYTSSNSRRVLHMMSKKAGCCYKLSDETRSTLYNLYLLMYLGMKFDIIREKKLEYMLICDKIQRETYPLDKDMPLDDASVVFTNKDDFDRYMAAHHIYEDFLNCTDLNDKCNIVKQVYRLYQDITEEHMERYKSLPQWLHRFTPPSIFIKVLESGIQDLKRYKQQQSYELALDILDLMIMQTSFRQHKKTEWYAEKALILHSCLSRYDEVNELSGFSRGTISWDQLAAVTCCLGGTRVASICRRLATNYCYSHSGFPDLTLWNPLTKEIKFVEVKTDTDKPSMKQLQWMQYLRTHDIDTEFCYVGVHTTRQRCRVHTDPKPKVKKERKKKTAKRKNETQVKTEPTQENEPEGTEPVVQNETRVKTEPVQENEPEGTEPVVENQPQVRTQPVMENETRVKSEPDAKTESKIRAQLLFE